MQLQQTSLLSTKTKIIILKLYLYMPAILPQSMLYYCHNSKSQTVSLHFFSTNSLLIPCTTMKNSAILKA